MLGRFPQVLVLFICCFLLIISTNTPHHIFHIPHGQSVCGFSCHYLTSTVCCKKNRITSPALYYTPVKC